MKFSGGDLNTLKLSLQRQIDDEAEATRAKFITLGAGMAMVYDRKEREADLIITATGEVDLALVPLLVVEASDLGMTLIDVALLIKSKAQEWAPIAAAIEQIRLSAKRSISAAITPQQAREAAAADWP